MCWKSYSLRTPPVMSFQKFDLPSASRGLQCPDGPQGIGEEALKAYCTRIFPSRQRSHADPNSLGGQGKRKMHRLRNRWMSNWWDWAKGGRVDDSLCYTPFCLHMSRLLKNDCMWNSSYFPGPYNNFNFISNEKLHWEFALGLWENLLPHFVLKNDSSNNISHYEPGIIPCHRH